jgi:hypothetical protein
MMMPNSTPCPIPETELLAYRDGELEPARQAAVSDHIAACPACQQRLAQAALVTDILATGSPLRDQPVARAAIHDRLAAAPAPWWQRHAVLGAALPVAILLLAVIGVNRWLREDDCANCPPQPEQMEITAVSGLPAGWSTLLPCPTGPPVNLALRPANQLVEPAQPRTAVAAGRRPNQPTRHPSGQHRRQAEAPSLGDRLAAARETACELAASAPRPGLHQAQAGHSLRPRRSGP